MTQRDLFSKSGLPGQRNLFPDTGVPDDMVQTPAEPKTGQVWRHLETGINTTVAGCFGGTVRHIQDNQTEHWLLATSLFLEWYEFVSDYPSMAKGGTR